ncbi:hemolysin family protein [Sagittula salina]|uniref:HlyC/CorC family transporter n=1 Tax=Sagittula salina TaxID=2820268 RepID=A0A940MTB6_9RHOB|nr:hemolysin family protein [Sagittula salina]MBP0483612.1 HlyC/CorC family transporter [Sagittula salina]
MGDNDDSSNAAQGAQTENDQGNSAGDQEGGFLRRLFGWSSKEDDEGEEVARSGAEHSASPAHGMVNLRRMRVEDVAIPKAEIIAVPDTITKDDLVKVFRESGLTRLPVYEGTLDTPVGMAHLKDFALAYGFNGAGARFNLRRMLRPLLYVPPSMPLGVLLTKMQTERRHMALVIDEYGGVDGLVTIEDLIEQVVGEIADEHDTDDDQTWVKERAGCWLALAKTPLDEFEEELGFALTQHDDIDEEEIDTLGGLVFMLAGRVPARGEVIRHPAGVDLEVVDADPRRIKRLRVRLPGTARAQARLEATQAPVPLEVTMPASAPGAAAGQTVSQPAPAPTARAPGKADRA